MPRRLNPALPVALFMAVAFVAWTWLTFRTRVFDRLDASSLLPGPDPMSNWGQIMTAVATLTSPAVLYTVAVIVSVWAWHKRLKNLAWAWLAIAPLGWLANLALKMLVQRARPESPVSLITARGWAYPSGHMTALAALAVLAVATVSITRRPIAERVIWLTGSLAILGFVGYNRWALRAHWFSDLGAGVLWGVFLASAVLVATGARMAPSPLRTGTPKSERRLCAVVVNPTKVPDWEVFRGQVEGAASERGWTPIWIETSVDDPGFRAARQALERGVDRVLAVGGDGTVRSVCAELAGSRVPIAVVPAGTGNLLARNLNVPLDLAAALEVAFGSNITMLDLVEIRADAQPPDYSVVMAGMGLDAIIMDETRPELKKVVGAAAYLMAGLQALNKPPFQATVTVDDGEPHAAMAGMIVIANVGAIQGNVHLFPDALPDDGLADVLVASPTRRSDWGLIASQLVRGSAEDDRISRDKGGHIVVETIEPIPYQIDGDTAGECRRLAAHVLPRAVSVMVP